MKRYFHYLIVIGIICFLLLIIIEVMIMPAYVRSNDSRKLINVQNLDMTIALARLNSHGFRGIIEDTVLTNDLLPNTIIDQYPDPYSRVKPGRMIKLKIVQPEKMVLVPNLIGHSKRSSELILHRLGLQIDTIYTEYNPEFKKGTVAWQSPKRNDLIKKGWGVHLTISKGMPPDFFQVPNLFGLSHDKAILELERAGLEIGIVSYEQNEDLIPYTVLYQSIKDGTVLDRAQKIDITVSVIEINDIFNQVINK